MGGAVSMIPSGALGTGIAALGGILYGVSRQKIDSLITSDHRKIMIELGRMFHARICPRVSFGWPGQRQTIKKCDSLPISPNGG